MPTREVRATLDGLEADVVAGKVSPSAAASRLLDAFREGQLAPLRSPQLALLQASTGWGG